MATTGPPNILDFIDYTKPSFLHALACIVLAPIIWTCLARLEFYTRAISAVAGSPRIGCYLLATWIFFFSLYRDYHFSQALEEQARHPGIDSDLVKGVAAVLFSFGTVMVFSSIWVLGITGTYLGDYFGILKDKMVTGFPFNIMDHPMYNGSTMCFLAHSLWKASPAGLLLSLVVYVCYRIVLLFEEPFTAYIYSERDKKRKAASASASNVKPTDKDNKKQKKKN